MATDKYCKKSSLEALADEIRVRAGESSSTKYTFPSGFETAISGLLIPTQRGAPSKELKTNDTSYTIQKGVYTGGSVFVDPISYEGQNAINPSSSQQTIKDSTNNKPIKKVVINGVDVHPIATGSWRGSTKNPVSITISGLSFNPVGIAIIHRLNTPAYSNPYYFIRWFAALNGGTIYGYCRNKSASRTNYAAKITSASVSFGSNSVSISNVVCYDSTNGSQTAYFYQSGTSLSGNSRYFYYIWG